MKGLRFALRGIQSQQHPRAPGLLLGVVKEPELQLDLAGEGSSGSAVAGLGHRSGDEEEDEMNED